MGWPRFAHPFPRRLAAVPTDARLRAMAENPSYRAPHPGELLNPTAFTPPRLPPRERELLDAVLADPDADEPRLRFAEWCEARGDPRGEMIRREIVGERPASAGRWRPQHQPADAGRSPEWRERGERAALAVLAPWSPCDAIFFRGFVAALSLSGRAFISIGAELFRLIPLRGVRLVAVQPFMGELAHAPHVAKLEALGLNHNRIGDAGLTALAASPHLGNLRFLSLSHNNLGDDSVAELTRLSLPRLETLLLAENRFTAGGVENLRETFGSRVLL